MIETALRVADEELEREERELEERLEQIKAERDQINYAYTVLDLRPNNTENTTAVQIIEDLADSELGMTDRIRAILKAHPGRQFSPTEIRDLVVATGFSLDGRSNPMAEIHLVLKRITEKSVRVTKLDTEAGTVYSYSAASPAGREESIGPEPEPAVDPQRLQELCYQILRESQKPMHAADINKVLGARGMDLGGNRRGSASMRISAALRRLPKQIRLSKKIRGGFVTTFYEANK